MSQATLSREGYCVLLDAMLSGMVAQIRLYTNDPDLSAELVAADLVQPVFTGYVAWPLIGWTPAVIQDGLAFSAADPVIWIYTGVVEPLPIRGCYAVDAASGVLLWVWRSPGDPVQLSVTNPMLTITPIAHLPLCE